MNFESKSQNQQLIDKFLTMSLDIFCVASTDGTFKMVNPTFTRVLGYSEAELVLKPFLDFIHPDDRASTLQEVEKLATGQIMISFENRYRTKDGRYRVLCWTCSPDPETGLLYASARDVTVERENNSRIFQIQSALDQVSIIAHTDASGTITEVNDAFCKLSGYTREELIGQNHRILNSGAHSKEFFIDLWKTISNKKIWRGTLQNKKKSGEFYYVESVITPILNSENVIAGYMAIRFDVTAQKLAEFENQKLIAKTEEDARLLRQTGQLAKVGGWELDLRTGVVMMTEETQRIHEIDGDYKPLSYSNGSEWYPPEAWPKIQAAVEEAIKHGTPYDLESPFITAKGKSIWVRAQGTPVLSEGKITKLVGSFQDITDRKQADLESKLASQSMGFGRWKFNPVTQSLEWDLHMYTLFDVKPEEFSGAYAAWENALSPSAKETAVKELGLALSGEKEFNTEFEILLKNGNIRHIAGRGTVTRNRNNEAIMMYGLNWDVTDRVLKEKELKAANIRLLQASKLASLGEMSAGIAHEINNPLAIILGSVSVLNKFKDNPEKFEARITSIEKSCGRISKIVQGLKKFSRSGEKQAHERIDLCKIYREVCVLTHAKSERSQTAMTFEGPTEAFIDCDEVEIEQVLVNLINNAIDAVSGLPEKWIKVSIAEERDSASSDSQSGNSTIMLRITDSGKGISKETRQKLFDPFFTTKAVGQGTGLGLSITKGILDEHKATISVLAECPNTCFEIRFKKGA